MELNNELLTAFACARTCVYFATLLIFLSQGEPEETNYTAAGAAVNTM